jgi:flagellar assembly protein FliH
MATIIRSPVLSPQKRILVLDGHAPKLAHQVSQLKEAVKPIDVGPEHTVPPTRDQCRAQEIESRAQEIAKERVEEYLNEVKNIHEKSCKEGYEDGGRKGYENGFEKGYAEGSEKAQGETAGLCERLESLVKGLGGALENGIKGHEDIILEIAFEAICSIVGDSAVTPAGVAAQVQKTIDHIHHREALVIRLHSRDIALLHEQLNSGKTVFHESVAEWVADDSIDSGGCVIETSGGTFEARLDRQLECFRTALVSAHNMATTEI